MVECVDTQPAVTGKHTAHQGCSSESPSSSSAQTKLRMLQHTLQWCVVADFVVCRRFRELLRPTESLLEVDVSVRLSAAFIWFGW